MSERRRDEAMRCLLVGLGGMGQGLIRFLQQKPWFEPVGVVDVRQEALDAAQTALHLPDDALFQDLPRALSATAPDAAIINTPSGLHCEQSRAALEAGAQVLVAKPVTREFGRAVELVRLAEARGLTLSVGQQIRYNRHYIAAARFVRSGALGEPGAAWLLNSKPRPDVRNLVGETQPALLETTIHHLDSLLAVFPGRVPEWVMCDGFRPEWSPYEGPCMVNLLVRFSGGLHVVVHSGFSAQAPMYEFRIEGTKGTLRCRGLHMSNDLMSYEFAAALGQFEAVAVNKDVPLVNPWVRFLDAWHDYAGGGERPVGGEAVEEPPFSGRNNLPVMAMVCAAIESIETGGPIELVDNPRYRAAFGAGFAE